MTELLVISDNEYSAWDVDEEYFTNIAKNILKFYLSLPLCSSISCLNNLKYDTLSFDILYTDSLKTHSINKEYRSKDYPADIITFAIFADSDDKLIFDSEINLGEIIIALDKVIDESEKKGVSREHELAFLISHGILHLLGFDHATEEDYNFIMDLQNRALNYVKI